MSHPAKGHHDQRTPGLGVISLDKRRVGQCVVCFKTIDARFVWRGAVTKNPNHQNNADQPLCDEHAEERLKL